MDHPKTYFPHNFLNDKLNSEINLNYIGKVPGPEYFNNPDNYFEFLWDCINNNVEIDNWSLKKESIRYCLNDCISLAEVILKFNDIFFDNFKINIHNYPTTSSLAFALFRSNYLPKLEKEGIYIPLINGSMYDFLKLSYLGGSNDMIIPRPRVNPETGKKEKIYIYDINSSYPKNMGKGMLMPVVTKYDRSISYFEGDILQTHYKPFGFFDVDISTTKDLEIPVLQTRKKLEHGTFTISPLGKWSGVYFSEELYNAKENFGYEFKVHSGYLFNGKEVFSDFVSELYKIKQNSPKGSPMHTMAKLLLNTLYGRFGMSPFIEKNLVISEDDLQDYLSKYTINDIVDFENGKLLITYVDKNINSETLSDKKNVSVAIASAISAYARVYITPYKNKPGLPIYYYDTDSIVTDTPLHADLIGPELGQFKLEHELVDAAFIAPKLYGGISENGKIFTKAKGLVNKLSFSDLQKLLNKNEILKLNQDKWFKSINNGSVTIMNQLYNLSLTENKRELIFDDNGVLVSTKPFVIDEIINRVSSNKVDNKENASEKENSKEKKIKKNSKIKKEKQIINNNKDKQLIKKIIFKPKLKK